MMQVLKAGMLSLVQDAGRIGQHRIGLTTGGALDQEAMQWANRLCGNALSATVIEISVGGLVLQAHQDTIIVLTGAEMPLSINQQPKTSWRGHYVRAGERIELGYATMGCRAYLAVAGGFTITPMFASTATVVRECIGGLKGTALQVGDQLPHPPCQEKQCFGLARKYWPQYSTSVQLRVVLGYQQASFSAVQQALFFSSEYRVSPHCDRMGYRLEGVAIQAAIKDILSEGISYGAIQFPADGQPIVLLNDRQTIGGYPKIGSVFSGDLGKLVQLSAGGRVRFVPITQADAHNLFHLAAYRFTHTPLFQCEET